MLPRLIETRSQLHVQKFSPVLLIKSSFYARSSNDRKENLPYDKRKKNLPYDTRKKNLPYDKREQYDNPKAQIFRELNAKKLQELNIAPEGKVFVI